MKSILLTVVLFGAVLARPQNCDGCEFNLIKSSSVETLQTNLTSTGTAMDQLSTKLVDHSKIVTKEINQFDSEPFPIDSCPENVIGGVYLFQPEYSTIPPFPVYCNQGWIMIHRRYDGNIDFNRNWASYKEGFGDMYGEHWLGLEKMHQITRVGNYELMVVLRSFDGVGKVAMYDDFNIGGEYEQYQLKLAWFAGGSAGDSLMYHNMMKFSTPDRKNDETDPSHTPCAELHKSGWWFNACRYANLNGLYEGQFESTMSWYHFNYNHENLKEARMMIRRMP